MILSDFFKIYKIYVITKRDFVIDFFRKAAKIPENIFPESLLPDIKSAPNNLVVVDALIFESSSSSFLESVENRHYPILCLEPFCLSEKSRLYVESNFRYIIPFPAYGDSFLNYFFENVEKMRSNFKFYNSCQSSLFCSDPYYSSDSAPGHSFCKNNHFESSLLGFFVGESESICNVRNKIKKIAISDAPVLLVGETGTGKSTAASIIHKLSKRNRREMKALNISTVDESVACSTFFGTTLGAFTDALEKKGLFTLADKGTLFLDEIGIASPTVQSMLLTVVETGMFRKVGSETFEKSDVRLLFATNADLVEMVKEGSFRKDFFCRICGNVIKFPNLRSRKEDIPYIINHYIAEKNKIFSDDAIDKLVGYNWPGNIRELHQCVDRALLYSSGEIIGADDIDFGLFCL